MAFRMTRPTIQGTEYHKASVLKARAETVTQTRTAADPTLVAAGSELGKSHIPKAVDFTIKPAEIKIPEGDGKKKEVEPKVEPKKVVEPTVEKAETEIKKPKVEEIIVGDGNTPYANDDDAVIREINQKIEAEINAKKAQKAIADQKIKDQEARELEEKNKAIREQNKVIVEAKKFYGITGDGKLTRSKLEEYQNMRVLQEQNEAKYQQNPIEIEEESDPDFIQKPTQVEPSTQSTIQTTTKPKLSDFKDGKNAFGGFVSKKQAYDEATRKWRKQNPIQMRDDAIYKNAIKDGIVQKNMIKSGYKPLD
jgi:hypothetical protein